MIQNLLRKSTKQFVVPQLPLHEYLLIKSYRPTQRHLCFLPNQPFNSVSRNHQPIIASKINIEKYECDINSLQEFKQIFAKLFAIDQQTLQVFEQDCYCELIVQKGATILVSDEQYESFMAEMLLNHNLNISYLYKFLASSGKAHLFPSNQRLIMHETLQAKQLNYQRSIKKGIRYVNLYLKLFAVSFLISLLYRGYYYLEYDISINHPRATSWHVYRFR